MADSWQKKVYDNQAYSHILATTDDKIKEDKNLCHVQLQNIYLKRWVTPWVVSNVTKDIHCTKIPTNDHQVS